MSRILLAFIVFAGYVMVSPALVAQNHLCSKWENRPDYMQAISTVAASYQKSYIELCTTKNILDIEVQPSRIILRDGTIVPHLRVQLHYEYDSCLFMVNKESQEISKQHCYSGT